MNEATQNLLSAYRTMLLAREIDKKAIVLYKQNKSHFHIGCAGHEAIQVATAKFINGGSDWSYPYYRDLAYCVALGVSPKEIFLGVLNKALDPASGGRQMPMHFGHKDLRIVSQSSPTGTQYLQACGCAKAIKEKGLNEVVYVSSGEGTTAQGEYHETLNWAARRKLPLVLVVQDNDYAISVHISDQIAGESVAQISTGYNGLIVESVDGTDYEASLEVMQRAVERARKSNGPTVVVAKVVRLQSHSISDNHLKYRSDQELKEIQKSDPIIKLREKILALNASNEELIEKINAEVIKEVNEAAEWAEEQEDPKEHTACDYVYKKKDPGLDCKEQSPNGDELFMVDAINKALDEEMGRDKNIILYGQDVAYGKGGVFSVTSGLTDKYGAERCFNAPLAEASIIGTAVGIASSGYYKPIVEIQFGDYIWTAMMQIRNELALMHYRSNGNFSAPVVVRVAIGGYIHGGLYHSQNIEATFAHFPGLHIVMPSNAGDAKGLLKSAIRSNDPVLFLEHKGLYRQVYAKSKIGQSEDLVPLGRAKVIKEGSDATIITWGALVQKSLLAAKELEQKGKSIEVVDLRSLLPLDVTTIVQSVKKTGRVLIAHEDVVFMGFGAEVSAAISESAFEYLDAPIMRVGGKFSPIPHSGILEKSILPQNSDVLEALNQLLDY